MASYHHPPIGNAAHDAGKTELILFWDHNRWAMIARALQQYARGLISHIEINSTADEG